MFFPPFEYITLIIELEADIIDVDVVYGEPIEVYGRPRFNIKSVETPKNYIPLFHSREQEEENRTILKRLPQPRFGQTIRTTVRTKNNPRFGVKSTEEERSKPSPILQSVKKDRRK